MTDFNQETFAFTAHFSRRVEAGFTAGQVSTDGGVLLLREVDRKINLLGRLAGCFLDGHAPLLIKHRLPEMLPSASSGCHGATRLLLSCITQENAQQMR
jgi:hypothetical protein